MISYLVHMISRRARSTAVSSGTGVLLAIAFLTIGLGAFGCPVPLRAEETGPVTLDFTPLGISPEGTSALAPMDRSFGIYPMSVLGIGQAIKRYYGTSQLDDGPIAYAIPAIRDWEQRYPHDPWVAKELLAMQHVYEHAKTEEGDRYARAVAAWLQADYPSSKYAADSRSELPFSR